MYATRVPVEFSKRKFKILRQKKLKMSQAMLAKELFVTELTILRWEHGICKPSRQTIRRVKEFCEFKKVKADF